MALTRTPKQTAGPRRAGASRPRPVAPTRRTVNVRRRKPEPQSNAKKVVGALATALPGLIEKAGKPAKKAKPNSRKGGAGLAILGAGAGFAALKNRNKLPGKLGGRSEKQDVAVYEPAVPVSPPPVHSTPDGPAAV